MFYFFFGEYYINISTMFRYENDLDHHPFSSVEMISLLLLAFVKDILCVSEEEHLAKMIGKPPPPKDLTIEVIDEPNECEMTTKIGNTIKVSFSITSLYLFS